MLLLAGRAWVALGRDWGAGAAPHPTCPLRPPALRLPADAPGEEEKKPEDSKEREPAAMTAIASARKWPPP